MERHGTVLQQATVAMILSSQCMKEKASSVPLLPIIVVLASSSSDGLLLSFSQLVMALKPSLHCFKTFQFFLSNKLVTFKQANDGFAAMHKNIVEHEHTRVEFAFVFSFQPRL